MGKKVRSARGELVDFDLLKIKEQMASAPTPTDVRARQDFIEQRLRRRLKKVKPPAPKIKSEGKDVAVDPKMPATEELNEETKLIDEKVEAAVEEPKEESRSSKKDTKKKTTKKKRQRARPLRPEED